MRVSTSKFEAMVPQNSGREIKTPPAHLFLVLVDVEVQLTECAQCVELVSVQTGLLHQVGVHVLITDAGHLCNIPVVPARQTRTQF